MNKKIIATVATLVIILTGVLVWISQRQEQPEKATEPTQETANKEQTEPEETNEEIPAEFQDNLDQAFEDLDAIDL